jgi:hypothetical protein
MKSPKRDEPQTKAQMGKWTVTAHENGEWNNNKYSKSWHRKYGGVWEVESRDVTFSTSCRKDPKRVLVKLTSWRGDWLAKAVAKAGLAPEKSAAPMSVRLNKAYDAKIVMRRKQEGQEDVAIWKRTLLGETIDFCAVGKFDGKKITYHDSSWLTAMKGLEKKAGAQRLRAEGRVIDRALIKNLHFCDQGVAEFCRIVGIENRGTYTPEQIHEAIQKAGYRSVAHFAPELKTLAKAVNFDLTGTPLAD